MMLMGDAGAAGSRTWGRGRSMMTEAVVRPSPQSRGDARSCLLLTTKLTSPVDGREPDFGARPEKISVAVLSADFNSRPVLPQFRANMVHIRQSMPYYGLLLLDKKTHRSSLG